ncbi:MAG TPA: hypothetical protein VHG92_11650, partial [Afifellaceae bacterium]|nr:hypothetical protein [Afifellaceae bacterium]
MTAERSQAGSRLGSLVFAALFGLALCGVFAAAWLGLERAWTEKATLVAAIVAGAGGLAAMAALLAMRRLAMRPFALRFAVVFLCVSVGTAGFASFGIFLHAVWTTAMPED